MIKKVAVIALVIVASLLVAGCTSSTNNNQAASSASKTASSVATKTANTTTKAASASVKPSASASVISPTPKPTLTPTPTPTPTATPVPKPQCTHVNIVVYFPVDAQYGTLPCMMCAERFAMLSEYADQHKPYVTVTSQAMPDSSWGDNTPRVSATVIETGVSQSFDPNWGEPQIMVWVDGVLTCK